MSSEAVELSEDITKVVAANIRYRLTFDEKTPGRGAAKLARLTGWGVERCRALYYGRAAANLDEVYELAQAFGVDVETMFMPLYKVDEGGQVVRATDRVAPANARKVIERWADDQCRAFGRELARSLWETAGEEDYQHMLLNEAFSVRATHPFWDAEKLALAARYALRDVGDALAARFPYRDRFPYREVLPLGSQIISDDVAPEPRGR